MDLLHKRFHCRPGRFVTDPSYGLCAKIISGSVPWENRRKDRSRIKFQVFVSPGKSDADEQHVGDDEYVNLVDMGHRPADETAGVRAGHWARRDRHAMETKHDSDLIQKIVAKGSLRRALTRKAAVFFSHCTCSSASHAPMPRCSSHLHWPHSADHAPTACRVPAGVPYSARRGERDPLDVVLRCCCWKFFFRCFVFCCKAVVTKVLLWIFELVGAKLHDRIFGPLVSDCFLSASPGGRVRLSDRGAHAQPLIVCVTLMSSGKRAQWRDTCCYPLWIT